MKSKFIFTLLILFPIIQLKINNLNSEDDELFYSTTWATSLYQIEPTPLTLSNNSLRQIIRVSSSSQKLRLKLSNKTGKTNLEIKSINIADSLSQGTGEIMENTLTPIKFGGEESIIIPPGVEIYSDIFSYNLKSLSEVSISIFFGQVPSEYTGHEASMTNSFIEEGNKINNVNFSTKNKISHYYFISLIEILSSKQNPTIVCFGDSITDGVGSTMDQHSRYPDLLATKIKLNLGTSDISVINEGKTATRFTTQGIERFRHDVLEIKGIKDIILLYGVNDINWLNSEFTEIIEAYKSIIKLSHENNIFIYGCTILPYGRNNIWTEEREKVRKEVNNWIRNTKSDEGGFDAFFDFDEFIKDPNDDTIIKNEYDSGDGIHPNSQGYLRMVQSIDNLTLFTKETKVNKYLNIIGQIGVKFKLDINLEKNTNVSITLKGKCEDSKGFRVAFYNDQNKKTSDYYYSGKIEKGNFEFNINLKISDISSYIYIRRPISTINIDFLALNYLEISSNDFKQIFNVIKEFEFL